MSMKINDKLKELRKEAEVSQSKVAKELGITAGAYANYEQGTREPSLDMVVKLCDFYKVSADYLLGRED